MKTRARNPEENDYNKSKLRILSFDRAFNHCSTDAQQHKAI